MKLVVPTAVKNVTAKSEGLSKHATANILTIKKKRGVKSLAYHVSNSINKSSLNLIRYVIDMRILAAYKNLEIQRGDNCLYCLLTETIIIICKRPSSRRKKGGLV